MQPFELIHRPLGDHHPYESGADERIPRYPYSNDRVELGVLTRPIGSTQKVSVSFWVAENPDHVESRAFSFAESVPLEVAFTEDGHLSEAAARAGLAVGVDRWRGSLPSFAAGTRVCYQLTAAIEDETLVSRIYEYTVRKIISLDDVVEIFYATDSIVILLKNPEEDSHGYLNLRVVEDGHLQVEAGYGDCPKLENAKLTRSKLFEKTEFVQNFGDIRIQVDIDEFKIQIFYQGNLILSTDQAPHLDLGENEGVETIIFSFASSPEERFFGFGERFNALDQRGQRLDTRVYEQYKNHGLRTYLPMPLFISSQGYGVLVQSLRDSIFDLAHNNPESWTLSTELGEKKEVVLDIFLGASAQLLDIVARLNAHTGRPVLPPNWAFGLWMSSNEWNTQARVEEIMSENEKHAIPASVIVLEAWSDENTFYIWNNAHYTPKSGRDSFNYADFYFPPDGMWTDPKGMVDDLHKKGLRVLLWQIPVLAVNENNHIQLANDKEYVLENDFCVQREDGSPYLIRPFWFHDGLLMDFTHSRGVEWWMQKRAYLLADLGIDGFKTDGGEHIWGQDLVFSDNRRSDEIRNEYPNLYAGAYFQFSRKYKPNAITFSRAGFTGAQAFPCHWAGDENSTWEAFRHSIMAGLNASISGIAFWGWDFAGFSGEIPTAELYLRAAAMAAFCPIMQYHSEYNHHRKPSNDRTPWNIAERTQNPDVIPTFRFFARVRMNLMPYILHSARQSASDGVPMMRPLSLVYPQDETVAAFPYQYLFGDLLLVAPITETGLSEITVYLPEGDWYSFWDEQYFSGGRTYNLPTSLAQIPVFVKANSLLPLNLDDTYVLGCDIGNQTSSLKNLCFKFFPTAGGNYTWYDEEMQAEVQFVWEEKPARKFVLHTNAVPRSITVLLPDEFVFDLEDTETIFSKRTAILRKDSANSTRILVSKRNYLPSI